MIKTIACVVFLATAARGHELEENRATFVLRDRTHLSATFFLSLPEALWQALAPQRPFAAFLLTASGMKPEEFATQLRRAQSRFETATRVYAGTREAALGNWTWPDAVAVQALLQRRVMQAIADPAAHTHEPPAEVRADLVAPQEIFSVRVQFPEEWRKVLVVWFRPGQQWVEGKSVSAEMRFGGGL